MDAHELASLLRARPFCPLLIQLRDGQSYEIPRPGLAIVTPTTVAIGIARGNGSRLAERIIRRPIADIVSVEQLQTPK
jgi:hypothetical protein